MNFYFKNSEDNGDFEDNGDTVDIGDSEDNGKTVCVWDTVGIDSDCFRLGSSFIISSKLIDEDTGYIVGNTD